MIIFLLGIACGTTEVTPSDYTLELCLAIEECDLMDTFQYQSANDCMSVEESKIVDSVFDVDFGMNCVEETRRISCDELVQNTVSSSCQQWLGVD